jgi:hypothetical protein
MRTFMIVVAVPLVLLGACADAPDAINPVVWYDSAKQAVSGEDGSRAESPPARPPGADRPFPNLADVPPRPFTRSLDDWRILREQLTGDREEGQRLLATSAVPRS